jgi:phosphotransacetylase
MGALAVGPKINVTPSPVPILSPVTTVEDIKVTVPVLLVMV